MRRRIVNAVLVLIVGAALGTGVDAQGGQGAPAGGQRQGGGQGGGRGGGRGFSLPPLLMETDAFPDGGIVPPKFVSANNGASVLPGFMMSNAPAGTVAYAVIFHDLDVSLMGGTGDVLHWMAWDIPASANGWPEGMLPAGSVQGKNLRGQNAYMGPGAPPGPRYHHYVFELYGLNAKLNLPDTASRDDLLKALQGKVTAKAAYVGRYRSGEAPARAQ
jgi:Raf kinase inhibitor-like YbhB/YbcL family protein